jgi:hypothetical protein
MKRDREKMLALLRRLEAEPKRFVRFEDFFDADDEEEVHHLNLLVQEGRLILVDGDWRTSFSGVTAPTLRKSRHQHLGLNARGHEFVEHASQPWWQRWYRNVASNVPTILSSLLLVWLSAWLLELVGPDRRSTEPSGSEVPAAPPE